MGNIASRLVDADASNQGHHSPQHAPSPLFAGPDSSTEGSVAHGYRIPGAFDDIISNSVTTTLPASKPRPCLGGLPEELLLKIVEHVGNNSAPDMQTLLSLCRVDQRFRRLTTPCIYEFYDTRYGNPFLFIRTLVIALDFAAYVKHVSWGKGVTLVSDQGWVFRMLENPPIIIGRAEYKISSDDKYFTMSRLLRIGTPHAIEIASRFLFHDTNTYLDGIFLTAILMLVPNIVPLNLDQIYKASGGFQCSAMHSWTDLI